MSVLIALSGKPRHGKDSVAAAIENSFPAYRVKRYSISELICDELGLDRASVQDVSVLQQHSWNRINNHGAQYWIEKIVELAISDAPDIGLLTNLRRRFEADLLALKGWTLVRVTALNPDGSLYVPMDANRDLNDPLETELDLYGFRYHLSAIKPGGLAWLQKQAVALTEHLLDKEAVK